MGVTPLSRADVTRSALNHLDLASDLPLETPEALATLLRRCAAVRCPCTPGVLVRNVMANIRDLVDHDPQELLQDTLERLVDYGDLLELEDQTGSGSRVRQLFVAPASSVNREDRLFLVGVADETVEGLPQAIRQLVHRRDVTRYIDLTAGNEVLQDIAAAGYTELPVSVWTQAPRVHPAHHVVEQYRSKLRRMPHAAGIEGLIIVAGDRAVDYYKGRWVSPKRHSGEYVARRPQPYGAPLWCFVRLSEGIVTELCDLPVETRGWRGCDEAWYLQAALDSIAGTPQIVRARRHITSDGVSASDFFSPLPRWVNRRLQYTGSPMERTSSLLSFSLPERAVDEEMKLLQAQLWLRVEDGSGQKR